MGDFVIAQEYASKRTNTPSIRQLFAKRPARFQPIFAVIALPACPYDCKTDCD